MKIIISPAKRMKEDTDGMPVLGMPPFPEKTGMLYEYLKGLSLEELKALLRCNDSIAAENYRRYQEMDRRNLRTPAIFAYQGIQYQYMAPTAFTDGEYAYLQSHLRILSGFYGCLRPFDGIYPYRLEMQAKPDFCGNLYRYWGDDLGELLSRDNELVVDLASEEYSRAARQGAGSAVRFLGVRFGELIDGKFREKGTQCKMARGTMVRWMAEHRVENPEDLKRFDLLDYRFSPDRSGEDQYTFVRER